jgi:homoserine kinase
MSVNKVEVYSSASVANVACGFDIMGFAVDKPGDKLSATLSDSPGARIIKIHGTSNLPLESNKNTAAVAAQALLEHLNSKKGIEIELYKNMPLGSGLGSSAASAAAGVFAANLLLGSPLKKDELVPFAMLGEKIACGSAHADNVAPALLGGFVLIRSYEPLDLVSIKAPDSLYCAIVHPHIEVRTEDARKILRKDVALKLAVKQWGNIAGLVAGLITSDYQLIGRSLQDVIVEPERALLIPGFEEIKKAALGAGALGCSISGSGPSIFALSDNQITADKAAFAMQAIINNMGISSDIYVSKINTEGTRLISSE